MHRILISAACLLAALSHTSAVHSAPPGPKPPGAAAPPSPPRQAARPTYDIPPLTIAVPVFDPGLPRNPAIWDEKGIWPELRKAEAVRAASSARSALRRLNRFNAVLITPDDSVSADLYLLGGIRESNGEDFSVSFDLVDATGSKWLRGVKVGARRPERELHMPVTLGDDPFSSVWAEVAQRVDDALGVKARRHAREHRRNAGRERKDKPAQLTDLERVAAVRDLAFAGHFSPGEYGSALQYGRSRIRLVALPLMSGESWRAIEAVQARDDQFNARLTAHYEDFADRMAADYALWQADAFPVAHERRKRREAAVAQGIGALLLAGVAAGASDDLGVLGTTAAAVSAGALAMASFRSNEARRNEARRLNELGASVNAAIAPMNVEMDGRQETLTGAAHEQFAQWRQLLKVLYVSAAGGPDAVRRISGRA